MVQILFGKKFHISLIYALKYTFFLRYLEEAIIHLNTAAPDTRTHLPLVVGEVRKHLSKFLIEYPHHIANRRITLIIMAANNLLK